MAKLHPLKDLKTYTQLPLLFDHWYVAGLSEEFSRELQAKTLLERRFEDVVFIWIDRALHDVFAQSVGGVDKHRVAKTALGVDREHDTGGTHIGSHHLLNADR